MIAIRYAAGVVEHQCGPEIVLAEGESSEIDPAQHAAFRVEGGAPMGDEVAGRQVERFEDERDVGPTAKRKLDDAVDTGTLLPVDFGNPHHRVAQTGGDPPAASAIGLIDEFDGDVGRPGQVVAAGQSERAPLGVGQAAREGIAPAERRIVGEVLAPRALAGNRVDRYRTREVHARAVERQLQRPAAQLGAVEGAADA